MGDPGSPLHSRWNTSNGITGQTGLHSLDDEHVEPIAVIGMACRLPGGASSPEKLWDILESGTSTWSKIPESRFNLAGFHDPSAGKSGTTNVGGGHFLKEDISAFDASFFGIHPVEASAIDPQHRLLLQVAYEAFENAGLTNEQLWGSNTGVFVGQWASDYHELLVRDTNHPPLYQTIGTGSAMASNRLSYFFNMTGPSFTVDTGCSASLVALHQAIQSLRANESDVSFVGGVNLTLDPQRYVYQGRLKMFSTEGRSFSFDSRAAGYGRGEGCTGLVLKSLSKALQDGDNIRAVIRNSACNQDGRTPGISVPSGPAQTAAIHKAFSQAGLTKRVDYIEAHGTGTRVGDPIEAKAIAMALSKYRDADDLLPMGSVKGNIGHLESAAGITGLLKAILMLEKGMIPPQVNFEKVNDGIPLNDLRLRIPIKLEQADLHRVAVNSFGYGGTNVHVVVESAADHPDPRSSSVHGANGHYAHGLNGINGHASNGINAYSNDMDGFKEHHVNGLDGIAREINGAHAKSDRPTPRIFKISGASQASTQQIAANLATFLSEAKSTDSDDLLLSRLSYSLSRRSIFPHREALIASTKDELVSKLESLSKAPVPSRESRAAPIVAFAFSGQGAQYAGMGRELLGAWPTFTKSITRAGSCLNKLGCPWDLTEELTKTKATSRVEEPEVAQPLSTAIQMALVESLAELGITPKFVAGHSSGEIAAAFCAKAISFEHAMTIAYHRGRLASELRRRVADTPGAMLAVGTSPEATQELIDQVTNNDQRMKIACFNSPSSVTVSGDESAIDVLQKCLDEAKIFNRKLRTGGAAYHSHQMLLIEEEYAQALKDIPASRTASSVTMVSSLLGKDTGDVSFGPDYWVKNLVSPVLFAQATQLLCQVKPRVRRTDLILEIGPHFQLGGAIKQTVRTLSGSAAKVAIAGTLKRGENAELMMLETLRALYLEGCGVNIELSNNSFSHTMPRMLTNLPPYSFDQSRTFWHEGRLSKTYRHRQFIPHELLGSQAIDDNRQEPHWRRFLRLDEFPWVRSHIVQGDVVFPAAAYISMAIQAMKEHASTESPTAKVKDYQFRNISFSQALVLTSNMDDVEITLSLRPQAHSARKSSKLWNEFRIFTVTHDNVWTEHCRGLVNATLTSVTEPDSATAITAEGEARHNQLLSSGRTASSNKFYFLGKEMGLDWGSPFDNLTTIRTLPGKSLCTLKMEALPAETDLKNPTYLIHPALLDSVLFHSLFAVLIFEDGFKSAVVPTFIKQMSISAKLPEWSSRELTCFAQRTDHQLMFDVDVFDQTSTTDQIVIKATSVSATKLPGALQISQTGRELCHTVEWVTDMNELTQSTLNRISDTVQPQNISKQNDSLDALALSYIQPALKKLSESDIADGHQKHWYTWMQTVASKAYDPSILPRNDTEDQNICHVVLDRLGPHLSDMLTGKTHPLSLLKEDDLLTKIYLEERCLRCYAQINAYCAEFAQSTPNMKVLEIGAGTASTTVGILEALRKDGRVLASQYDFTDLSPGFFSAAQEKLADYKDIVNYQVLNAEQDPATQGFTLNSYDVVVACNVIHATSQIDPVLRNVRSLLKPGGKFILLEITENQIFYNLIFGAFEGWWAGHAEGRKLSPILSIPQWSEKLQKADFEQTGMCFNDYNPTDGGTLSVFVSHAKEPERVQAQPIELITASIAAYRPSGLVKEIQAMMPGRTVIARELCSQSSGRKISIFLPDVCERLARSLQPHEFQSVKNHIKASDGVLFVTRSAESEGDRPDGSLVSGFCLSLRLEQPDVRLITLQLGIRSDDIDSKAGSIVSVLESSSFDLEKPREEVETEYMERDGQLHVSRAMPQKQMTRDLYESLGKCEPETAQFVNNGRQLVAELGIPGLLETIRWKDDLQQGPVGPDDVRFQLCAASINFKDVLIATGQLEGINLMQNDCSGIVTEVGENYRSKFKPGDRVCGLYSRSYTNYPTVHGDCVHAIPEGMSFEDAASVPIVWITVYYSLIDQGRLSKGESVLIHSAAGAVGQASILLAQHLGAEIFVTVGSDAKKQFLVESFGIKPENVFSSRTTDFYDGIKKLTNGRGVDVVLNSLSGEMFRVSCNIVAPFGRFVEIGRKDLMDDALMPMEFLLKNITFAYVDMALVITVAKPLAQRILHDVMVLLNKGAIKPVKVMKMPITEMDAAFRLVQAGKHIGKVILTVDEDTQVKILPPRPALAEFKADAMYVVVGGLGGLGKQIVSWMAEHGAKNIVTISRSGSLNDESNALVENLKSQGVNVLVKKCDIGSLYSVQTLLTQMAKELPPIRGLIQSAMVLQDAFFEDMTYEQWVSAVKPKVQGTWNLHTLLPEDLDFFVMLSSVVAISGNMGQGNYAGACTWQDAFAHFRNKLGLTAHSINVGAVVEAGFVSENPEVAQTLRRQGLGTITVNEFLYHLNQVITRPGKVCQSSLGLTPAGDEPGLGKSTWMNDMKYVHIRRQDAAQEQASGSSSDVIGSIRSLKTFEEAAEVMCQAIVQQLSKIIALSADQIDPARSLDSYGVDSLVAVELRSWIGAYLQANIALLVLRSTGSINELADIVTKESRLVEMNKKAEGTGGASKG